MSFSGDFKRFTEKAEAAAEKVFRGTALDIAGKIMQRSPVDTGRFRSNWQTALNTIPSGITEGTAQNAMSKAKSTTAKATPKDSIYFINNLPYSLKLEYGHSKQAPMGMVRLTVSEFDRIIQANAYKARK